jgi:hypothetical protein
MNKLTQAALVALAVTFSAGTVAHVVPAKAEVAVTFDSGNVAFGYSDGYWDRGHAWHPWPTDTARTDWQAHNAPHYYDRHHDGDPNGGWRDTDHWWGH